MHDFRYSGVRNVPKVGWLIHFNQLLHMTEYRPLEDFLEQGIS